MTRVFLDDFYHLARWEVAQKDALIVVDWYIALRSWSKSSECGLGHANTS
jgi:hypothetical protein